MGEEDSNVEGTSFYHWSGSLKVLSHTCHGFRDIVRAMTICLLIVISRAVGREEGFGVRFLDFLKKTGIVPTT